MQRIDVKNDTILIVILFPLLQQGPDKGKENNQDVQMQTV